MPHGQRFPAHTFISEKRQVTAVQQWYRQQIDQSKLQAEHYREHGDAEQAVAGFLASGPNDGYRSTHRVADRNRAPHHHCDPPPHLASHTPPPPPPPLTPPHAA